jgi:hypothetical protein
LDSNERDDAVRARLADAAATGEIVSVVYHGGSQPGHQRRIAPLAVSTTKVRAVDVETGAEKSYTLEKLELAEKDSAAPKYVPHAPASPLPEPTSLGEGLAQHLDALSAMGWQIDTGETEVSLHLLYRNGKPTPPRVTLRKNTEPVGHVFSITAGLDQLQDGRISVSTTSGAVESTRPWQVVGPDRTITYASLTRAIERFLATARKLAIGPPGILDEIPWQDMPVSKQVRGRLRNLGVEVPPETTRGEASILLRQLEAKSKE